MAAYEVDEGYSADNPIPEEEWEDQVFWPLRYRARSRQDHDQKGFFTELAGSDACLALGHSAPGGGWGEWDYEDEDYDHVYGWDGDLVCLDTRYGVACSYCEGECEAPLEDVTRQEFWALPGVNGGNAR